MPQSQGITPNQIPQLILQQEDELKATLEVLAIKQTSLQNLDEMDNCIASGDLAKALSYFIIIQKSEYLLQIRGFEEKRKAHEDNLKQLRSPLMIPSMGGFKVPR